MSETSPRIRLGDILTRLQLVDEAQVRAALVHQSRSGKLFGESLLDLGYVGQDDLSWALSSQLGLPYVAVTADMVDRDLVSEFPADFLRQNLVLPLVASGSSLSVVLADPTDRTTLARLERISGRELSIAVGTPSAIRAALESVLGEAEPDPDTGAGAAKPRTGAGQPLFSRAAPWSTARYPKFEHRPSRPRGGGCARPLPRQPRHSARRRLVLSRFFAIWSEASSTGWGRVSPRPRHRRVGKTPNGGAASVLESSPSTSQAPRSPWCWTAPRPCTPESRRPGNGVSASRSFARAHRCGDWVAPTLARADASLPAPRPLRAGKSPGLHRLRVVRFPRA
jgi:hypothetical protein